MTCDNKLIVAKNWTIPAVYSRELINSLVLKLKRSASQSCRCWRKRKKKSRRRNLYGFILIQIESPLRCRFLFIFFENVVLKILTVIHCELLFINMKYALIRASLITSYILSHLCHLVSHHIAIRESRRLMSKRIFLSRCPRIRPTDVNKYSFVSFGVWRRIDCSSRCFCRSIVFEEHCYIAMNEAVCSIFLVI